MPITYRIDPHTRMVYTRLQGLLTLEDALSHSHKLKTDPLFRPEFSELIDLTGFSGTDLNLEAMKAFARGLQGEVFSHHARRAVVAPADSAFDLSRKYQGLKESSENFQVFHSMDEAMQWLGLTPNKAMLFE
jgi:hypothetical protein